jgi:uncharacterized small protein (DUF1192 family)
MSQDEGNTVRYWEYNGSASRKREAVESPDMAVIDEEDLIPRNQPRKPKDLTLLGIAELEEYITALEAEITRARAEISAKQRQRGGAEALFKR